MPTSTPLTPTERMAAILRHLARAEGRKVSTVELRRLCPDDYEIREGMERKEVAARARKFRHDITSLRQRGFIDTGFTAAQEDMSNRQGVLLVRYVDKDPELHLTPAEHRALNRARVRLRPGPALLDVDEGRGRSLALGLAVVRYLEEQGTAWASGRHLADLLNVSVDRLLAALDALVENPVRDPMPEKPVVDDLEIERDYYEGTEEVIGFRVRLNDCRSARVRNNSASPTYGRGMHHVGRFAYTLAETRERLSLIAEAIDDPETPAADIAHLTRSGDKLRSWHDTLLADQRFAHGTGQDVS